MKEKITYCVYSARNVHSFTTFCFFCLQNRLFLLESESRRCYIEENSLSPTSSPTRNLMQLSRAFHSGKGSELFNER